MTIKNAAIIAAAFAWVSTPSVIFGQTTAKSADSTMTAMKASTLSLVREGERPMSQGSKNALTIDLPKTTPKEAEKLWKDYAKQFKGDTKKDKKTDEWFTDNAMIAAIGGANTIDMYTKFEETGGNTTACRKTSAPPSISASRASCRTRISRKSSAAPSPRPSRSFTAGGKR